MRIIPLRRIGKNYGVNKMSFEKRLEKTIAKKEKAIKKEQQKIEMLKEKIDSGKITRAEYNLKKKGVEEKIRTMNSRVRILQGMIAKEKRRQEELAEEKMKKKEEKEKKKQKKKK
jgi:hypothetical protein